MVKKLESFGWFLGFLLVTKYVVSPVVEKVAPKHADGTPFKLL